MNDGNREWLAPESTVMPCAIFAQPGRGGEPQDQPSKPLLIIAYAEWLWIDSKFSDSIR